MRDVSWQGIYPLAGHLQNLDFCTVLRRGIGRMIHICLVSFIYLVNYLFVILGLFCFTLIPSHVRRPEDAFKRLQLVFDPLWTFSGRM